MLREYKATVLHVVDGDTADVLVDLGFNVSIKVRLRIYGIDTPELKGPTREEGLRSRARLCELIAGKEVTLRSHVLDKYGRTVAEVLVDVPCGMSQTKEVDVGELLVSEGLAKRMLLSAILNEEVE